MLGFYRCLIMTTLTEARALADECWATGAQVEAEALRSLDSVRHDFEGQGSSAS